MRTKHKKYFNLIDHTIVIAAKQVTDFNTKDLILALTELKKKRYQMIFSVHSLKKNTLIKNSSEIRKKNIFSKMTLQ